MSTTAAAGVDHADHAAEECDYAWCLAHRACTCPYADMHPHRAEGCRYNREEAS